MKLRNVASKIVVLLIIMAGVIVGETKLRDVAATEQSYYSGDGFVSVKLTATQDAPKPSIEEYEDYLFAGWYSSETCTLDDACSSVPAGQEAYAKFVSADLQTVKCQITENTSKDSDTTDMRLISTVDSLQYKTVGYEVVFNGGTSVDCTTDTVFKRITAQNKGNEVGYSPNALAADAEYFVTVILADISSANFTEDFLIRPYWVTLDGTTVYGVERYARVEDSYLNIVNVPVRMYSDSSVGAGNFTVDYNLTSGETPLFDSHYAYDQGTLFESNEVTIEDNATDKQVTVTIPTAIEKPNGMVVNLRFKLVEDATLPTTITFQVVNESDTVGIDIKNVIYKNFPTTYSGTTDISWYTGFENEDTYAIASAADLYGLAQLVNSVDTYESLKNKTFRLVSDIVINDGDADAWLDGTSSATYGWTPIGTKDQPFVGTFDGQGHTISGIYLNGTTDRSGLFGTVDNDDATNSIKQLKVTNSYMVSSEIELGVIAGRGNGIFDAIYSDAYVVSQNGKVGGLIGLSDAKITIQNCWVEGTVTGTYSVGGFIGDAETGIVTIQNCLYDGIATSTSYDITNYGRVGGFCGYVRQACGSLTLTDNLCVGSASATQNSARAGSLVGQSRVSLSITDTYSTDEVTINNTVFTSVTSGFDGQATFGAYSTNNISSITGIPVVVAGETTLRGFDAYSSSSAPNLDYAGTEEKEAAWTTRVGDIPVPTQLWEGLCLPYADTSWYSNTAKGSDGAYIIDSVEDLYGLSRLAYEGKNFDQETIRLTTDITVNEGEAADWAQTAPRYQWISIGTVGRTAFSGKFDGGGNKISGLYLYENTDSKGLGLFGDTADNSEIYNFQLLNSYFESTEEEYPQIGSVVGIGKGTIHSIHSDATVVSQGKYSGGIVGLANSECTVYNCWFSGSVSTSDQFVGGIIGTVNGGTQNKIHNCLFTGKVNVTKTNGWANAGGLCGLLRDSACLTIEYSISDGTVSGGTGARGAVLGRIMTDSIATSVSKVVVSNVYCTSASGCTMASGDTSTVTDNSKNVDASDISGTKGYTETVLDFYVSESDTGYWVATEGIPMLYSFTTGTVDLTNVERTSGVETE